MKKSKVIIWSVLLCTLLVLPVHAQYMIKSSVLGNGFGVMSGPSYAITSTVGQPLIGISSGAAYIHHAGFWFYANMITGIEGEEILLPDKFELFQNYPNPFNPITRIKYAVPNRTHVRLEIYNVLGQKVRTLVNEEKSPGFYTLDFDASSLASGFYVYRMETSGFGAVKKMVITK